MSKPKLAVLDDYANIASQWLDQFSDRVSIQYFPDTLNPNDATDLDKLVERLEPFDVISTMRERTPFRKPLIERLPNLKVLFTTGPRNGGIDGDACAARGIPVVGTPGKIPGPPGYDTTNEQNWALILGLVKLIAENDTNIKNNPSAWQTSLALSLGGKTLGLLGLGRLGLQSAVTGMLGFGMNVIAWSSNLTQDKADEAAESRGLQRGSIKVIANKNDLLRDADVLSVHLVLSERSKDTISTHELSQMKKTAVLINTSRGPVINEQALVEALKQGAIYGYAADVFNTEPLPADSEFRTYPWGSNGASHVLLSPHMGYVTHEVLHGMYEATAENVKAWLEHKDYHVLLN